MKMFKKILVLLVLGVFLFTAKSAHAFDIINNPDPFTKIIDYIVTNPTSSEMTSPQSPWYSFALIVQPDSVYVNTVGTVDIAGVTTHDLANLTGNLLNDYLWWPGIVSTTLLEGTGGTGSVFSQVVNNFGITLNNTVYIAVKADDQYTIENSVGFIPAAGILVWDDTESGAKLTLHGLIKVPAGFDPNALGFFAQVFYNQAFTNLTNYFASTSTQTFSYFIRTTPSF